MLQPIWSFNPPSVGQTNCFTGAWLGTTSGSLAQLGGGHIPSTCTCSLGFSWVQGGCSWGVGCFAKNPSFFGSLWSGLKCGVGRYQYRKPTDTLLIFLLTARLALLSCRGSNIHPTTFMADSFRRHGFLIFFQFISSCRTSSFLGQQPQVETWLALQRLARNQARMFAMVLLPYWNILNMTCSVMLFGHSWHASSSLKTNPRWLQVYNPLIGLILFYDDLLTGQTNAKELSIFRSGSGKTLAFLSPIFAQLLESRADLRGPAVILSALSKLQDDWSSDEGKRHRK